MGLLVNPKDLERIDQIAKREQAPLYVVGETTGDQRLTFRQADGVKPIDMELSDFFGKVPMTVMEDNTLIEEYSAPEYDLKRLDEYLENVLTLESVACKDWLTNKVDRSVTGKVAQQQNQGEIQLPLSDCGAIALDYRGYAGMATSIGHAPGGDDRPRRRLGDGSSRGADQHRVRPPHPGSRGHFTERQLDVALPQPRRRCPPIQGGGGLLRFRLRVGNQHPHGERLALHDATVRR